MKKKSDIFKTKIKKERKSTMLKQKEWIDIIVAKTGCTKKEAKIFYDCVFDYMREQISPEETIKISGFGVLKLRKTAAKEQINLVTGQPEIVPEHNVVTFRPYFEIDPKPEPIEVEDEDVIAPVEDNVFDANEVTEDVAEEVVDEPVNEEEKEVEEVAPETVNAVVEEEEDGYSWLYEGNACTTNNIKQVLKQKTQLSDEDILASLNVVKENMKKTGKNTCEVKEEKETFDFIIVK